MTPKPPTVFFDNERVTRTDLVAGQRAACVERVRERGEGVVLLLQGTTAFDFSHHRHTCGLGPLNNAAGRGFWVHNTLAVSAAGVPLGVWDQQVWVRDARQTGKRQQRHEREFREKESYKWVSGLPDLAAVREVAQVVTVCDREGHLYEFLDEALTQGSDFVVRASRGRGFTPAGSEVFAAVAQWPVQERFTLTLNRRPDRPARAAQVVLRFGTLTLRRPQRAQAQRETLSLPRFSGGKDMRQVH